MDKILTEAYDKIKAIEESDNPFCIGELSENEEDVVEEEQLDEEHGDADDEMHYDYGEDKSYSFEDDSGHNYLLQIQRQPGGAEEGFVEVNGVTVAQQQC